MCRRGYFSVPNRKFVTARKGWCVGSCILGGINEGENGGEGTPTVAKKKHRLEVTIYAEIPHRLIG